MKHTIKLLTVAITLAAILTLTGCPGPVNPDKPCTHEHTRTEVIEEATYNSNGLGKIICIDCEEVLDEQAEISRFVAGGYDGDIPEDTANPEEYRYEYREEDDYQIMAYVYSSEDDALNDKNETVLYFSFPNEITDIPQIVTVDGLDGCLFITIDDLIQMKNEYIGKTVKYFDFAGYSDFLNNIKDKIKHPREDLILLTSLKRIYIVVE